MKQHSKAAGKGSSHKPGPSSSSHIAERKSRWESSDHASPASNPNPNTSFNPNPNPNPNPNAPSPHDHRPIQQPHLHPLAASPFSHPDPMAGPPTPPSYGFHNLDRRTIVLADGSVRSYFALPPDYPMDPSPPERFFPYGPPGRQGPGPGPDPELDRHFPPMDRRFSPGGPHRGPPQRDYWSSLELEGQRGRPDDGPSSLKRKKYGEEDEFAWHRQHVLQYGNPNAGPLGSGDERGGYGGRMGGSPLRREQHDDLRMLKHAKMGGEGLEEVPPRRGRYDDDVAGVNIDVDRQALKRAFLKFVKAINENPNQRTNYLEDGKSGPLKCIVCDRASKEFTDVHGLVMHAYNTKNADMRVDHLGFHKALCVLMGWSYAKAPENSKAYQSLSVGDVAANRDDLILWPPTVIVHNTNSGRRKDGRMDGLGNKDMDTKLKDLGFGGGKSKSIYNKEGHTGITVVKFANTQTGLKEAERLAEYFEKDDHGRKGWTHVHASLSGDDYENAALVKVEGKNGEKNRILYGYLAIASDLEKVDLETRKKAVIKSRGEFDLSE